MNKFRKNTQIAIMSDESLELSEEQTDTLYQMFLSHLSQGLTLINDFTLWVKEYFKYRTEFINLLEVY